jgi:site-specific recombinase XerC
MPRVVEKAQTRGRKIRRALHRRDGLLATGDIRATQQLVGHEDIATTANIYVAPNEASLERKLRDVYEGADN